MEQILKIGYQIILVVAFIVFFIALFASPIIYINIKQRKYFNQFAQKYYLQLAPRSHLIKRDFPLVKGTVDAKEVWIKATKLGEYSYNLVFNTQHYASPAIAIGVAFNKPKITKVIIRQKELFANVSTSDFDKYFDVVIEPKTYKNLFLNYDMKYKIMVYSKKNQSYFNLNLIDGFLISTLNFELISTEKYRNTVDRFQLLMALSNNHKINI